MEWRNTRKATRSEHNQFVLHSNAMYRSQFTQSKPLKNSRFHSPTATSKTENQDPAIYVSEVTIQLAGNTKEPSKKSSTLRATPSPRDKESNNSFSVEKNNSKDSLPYSDLSPRTSTPVKPDTQATTPERQGFMSPRAGKQNVSGVLYDNYLSGKKTPLSISRTPSPQREANDSSFSAAYKKNNPTDSLSYSTLGLVTKRPVFGTLRTSTPEPLQSPRNGRQKESPTESNADSSCELSRGTISHPPSERTSQFSRRNEFSTKKQHWYYEIVQRLEDLSWSYQTLETEYAFLERLMDEQKEDLKKAKSWSKHLKNHKPSKRLYEVH